MDATPPPADDRTVRNKQTELTASYLNSAAAGFFAAGVIAPLVAFAFGVAAPGGPVPTLTLAAGATIFLAISVVTHIAAVSFGGSIREHRVRGLRFHARHAVSALAFVYWYTGRESHPRP